MSSTSIVSWRVRTECRKNRAGRAGTLDDTTFAGLPGRIPGFSEKGLEAELVNLSQEFDQAFLIFFAIFHRKHQNAE